MTQDVRWIGPYLSKGQGPRDVIERHADPVTMDHIIELRKRILDLERHLTNYEKHYTKVYNALVDIRQVIRQADDPSSEVLRVISDTIKGL